MIFTLLKSLINFILINIKKCGCGCVISILCVPFLLSAQTTNKSYPLIGWQTFSGAIPDYYARFDLIISRHTSVDWANEMRSKNPDILLVPTYDWNTAQYPYIPNFPKEWFLYTSSGSQVSAYGDYKLVNVSDLCPRATSGPMAGMTYMEYLSIFLTELVDLNVFDGFATDGIWGRSEMYWLYGRPAFGDVDIDNDGVNDHNEHSKDWFLNHWQAGIDQMLQDLRQRIGQDKLIIINSGNTHDWGWSQTNGMIIEKLEGYGDDTFYRDYFNNFRNASYKPFVSLADGLPHYGNPDVPGSSKDDFIGMRFGLVTSMFNDLYFSFQNLEADEHYWSHWYDEFETDLGQPTSSPHKIRTGLWVRFFEKGCAIASVNGQPQAASDGDLRQFSEYAGPYYRFRGGQNPDFNNGNQFDSVNLSGRIMDDRYFGDGIILLKEPLPVISDIIIDNSDSGTSPSSNPADLSNFEQIDDRNNAYFVRSSSWLDTYAYAACSSGNGTATFTPAIGWPGFYEVFEWHPNVSGGANNVTYLIKYSGGDKYIQVDQTNNSGRWNSLGIFYFNKGTSARVEISANNTSGTVVADAVKFTYQGDDPNRDVTRPDPPRGLRVIKKD